MEKNVGTIDRTFRVIVGAGIMSMAFVGPKTLWGLIGVIPLASGLMGFCFAYKMFCPSTRSKNA